VAPSTASEFNAIRLWKNPIACWKVEDIRFAFDSSFVTPDIAKEIAQLFELRARHRKFDPATQTSAYPLLSVFGHADPVGPPHDPDSFNKALSGRRATVIYALLISNTDSASAVGLWQQVAATEQWGSDQRQTMQTATGLPDGTPDSDLYKAYMKSLCPANMNLTKQDFLAQGADPNGKGDYQGCSSFNPLLIFSQQKAHQFNQAVQNNDQAGIEARNAANAPNRRVVILLFMVGSKVDPAKWPCPSASAGKAGCLKRFWSNGDDRRHNRLPDTDRKFDDAQDTFACRFYQRISDRSPCEAILPPPVVCKFNIVGPADVPGLSKYKYKIDLPAGNTASGIVWSVDKPDAGFEGPTGNPEVVVTFKNSSAAWIKLKATFTLDGNGECAEKQIALVKVEVGTPNFTNPGKPSNRVDTDFFLVNPPPPPATATWVTTHDPGSTASAFTYNGSNQPGEPAQYFDSDGAGGPAFKAVTVIKLTSPPEKPTALQSIQVGYIQHGADSGSATYSTTPAGHVRTVTTPTSTTLDWLAGVPTDDWPWYDTTARETGSGTGTWSTTVTMQDSPVLSIPSQYNPNNASDPNTSKRLSTAAAAFAFVIRIAARTSDTDLGAEKHYFDEAHSTWTVNYGWPAGPPGVSLVTAGTAWTTPGSPSEVSVNVVPTRTNHNIPFLRWIPS
jgi:hypothetical protein